MHKQLTYYNHVSGQLTPGKNANTSSKDNKNLILPSFGTNVPTYKFEEVSE